MYQQRIATLASPRVEVTACQGDLNVAAWDGSEVLIEVEHKEALTVEEQENAVALAAKSDCRLTVPATASVMVVRVQGELRVQALNGPVEVATARGDATFRNGIGDVSLGSLQASLWVEEWVGAVDAKTIQGDVKLRQVSGDVRLETVSGDLTAEDVNGSLAAQSVAGDAYLRRVNGPLSLDKVNGDLVGRSWMAEADAAQVGGDVSLKSIFVGPHRYNLQARGDVVVRALPGSSATFTLRADKGGVKVKGFAAEETAEGQWQGVVGEGEAQVSLVSTHGNVMLKALAEGEPEAAAFTHETDFAGVGAAIHMGGEDLALHIQQRVAERLGRIDFEAIAQREAERARRLAEREAERALRLAEKARRKAEQARKKAEIKRGGRWHFEWDTGRGGRQAAKQSQAVSEEERLTVLKMLAEGKISSEEAEALLQALEG